MYRSFVPQVALSANAEVVCPPAVDLKGCLCIKALKDNFINIVCRKVKLDDLSIDNLLKALSEPGIGPTFTFDVGSKNNLTQVPPSLSKLPELRMIQMRDNQITSIPSGAFQSSSQTLITIILRKNKISFIEPGAFDYPNAESIQLDLKNNNISTIPAGVFEGNVAP